MSEFPVKPDPGSFFAGAVSGVCAVLVSQPFDIVKVRLQNSGGNDLKVLSNIVKFEGILSLWRGCGISIIGSSIGNSVSFGVVENAKSHLMKGRNGQLTGYEHMICGAYSGAACAFISTPTESIRIKLQTQISGHKDYVRAKDLILQSVRKGGPLSLYKGFSTTFIREVFGDAAYFYVYQMLPRYLFGGNENTEDRSLFHIMLSGGFAGIAYWTIIYPVDTIKSRLQADSIFKPKFKNAFDCFSKTVEESGVAQLYKGYLLCILRAFPINVALILGFELTMKLIGRDY